MPHTSPQLPQEPNAPDQNGTPAIPRTNTREARASFDLSRLLYGSAAPLDCANRDDGLCVPDGAVASSLLLGLRDDWMRASERAGHSPRTLGEKKAIATRLLDMAGARDWPHVGIEQLRLFFDHLAHGHLEKTGRFGLGVHDKRAFKPMRPITRKTHAAYLKSWFSWMVKNGHLTLNPCDGLERIEAQSDQITPFTDDQVRALLVAAGKSACPFRNCAIVLFLLDTGVRASELCGIRLGDVDFSDAHVLRVRVYGKGQKYRTLRLSREVTEAMWKYFKNEHGLERFYKRRAAQSRHGVDPSTPLFLSAHRGHLGRPLTRDGLRMLIGDLGEAAHIGAVRCSPHTFRHTFAISFLRAGGNIFALKEMLGHSSLAIVERYLKIAQADLETQHARFSPASALLNGSRSSLERR